jgi:hypothetical protein
VRIIVSERVYRAAKIGLRVGLLAAAMGFFRALGTVGRDPRWLLFIFLGPALSFTAYFSLVFLLAYAFPPASDSLRDLSFPGARWVVWPIMALLTLGTVYLVIHSRP